MYREAGLDGPSHFEVPRGEVVERSIDDVVAAMIFLSSAAPHPLDPVSQTSNPNSGHPRNGTRGWPCSARASGTSPSMCGTRA